MASNAYEVLYRCHSLNDLMTGVAKKWSVEKSATCRHKLVKIYREIKYKRKFSFSNKYTEKGIQQEEEAITLYSRFKGKIFKKNKQRFENDLLTGEPDIIDKTERSTVDIKCSWDLETFPDIHDVNDPVYVDQGQGYMVLTDSVMHVIVYCLVNTPANLIVDAKRRLAWRFGIIDQETEEYISECKELEKNSIFNLEDFRRQYPYFEFHNDISQWDYDIPIEERVIEFTIKRDEDRISAIRTRLLECRKYMNDHLFKI